MDKINFNEMTERNLQQLNHLILLLRTEHDVLNGVYGTRTMSISEWILEAQKEFTKMQESIGELMKNKCETRHNVIEHAIISAQYLLKIAEMFMDNV